MNLNFFKYPIYFLLLIIVDVFIVSQLQLTVYISPHIYFLFIFLLPYKTSKSLLILIGFLLGFVMDLFLDTGGMHASATTFIALLRVFLLPFFLSVEDMDNNNAPTLAVLGTSRFLFFTFIFSAFHHLVYFSLEAFDWVNPIQIIIRGLLSTVTSVILIFLIQLLGFKNSISYAGRGR